MKASELLEYSKSVLAGAVKLSQRKQLVDKDGKNWHDWVQAQPAGKKLSDPRKYTPEKLADFLASLKSQKPDPRAPGKELVKPQKLLTRYLPWLHARIQHDRAAGGGSDAAAAGGNAAAGGKQKRKAKQQPASTDDAAAASDEADKQAALKSDPVWQLMQRTRNHPRFHHWYNFDSYEKGWVTTGRPDGDADAAAAVSVPSGPWRLLGVDCEMCATAENDKELLQVAVVDEQDTLLMQELVLPSTPVTDYRTDLTGITASDLEGVTLTRKAAAKRLAKLLTPSTVLVGHGLHHDLQALKLDHPWVIDTSMIFEFKGLSSFTPSLALLSEQLLSQPLRGRDASAPLSTSQQQPQHDSREDASVALALVKQELQRGTPSPPLDPPDLKVDKADLCKLCVHKLPTPAGNSSSSVEAAAALVKASLAAACRQADAESAAVAVESAAVEQPGDSSKQLLFLVFKHAGVANDVFAALPGSMFTDSVGRHSKRQAMQGSSHKVVVRKMACHNGSAFGKDKASDRGAKDSSKGSNKKRKAPAAGARRPAAAATAASSKKPKQK